MKVLLIGRPGSGKTLTARQLTSIAAEQGYYAIHIDDYPVLCTMYREEGERTGRFCAAPYGDFDVLDFSALDEALWALEQQAQAYDAHILLIIECARDDYAHALAQFSADFLSDVLCLCIDTDLETCIGRIRERSLSGTGHEVSLRRMQGYYGRQLLPTVLPVEIIDNNGTQDEFEEQVRQFAQRMLVMVPTAI